MKFIENGSFFPEAASPLEPSKKITVRRATEQDKPVLFALTKTDSRPEGVPPEIFFEDGTECALIEDEDGPVMAFRLSRAVRIDAQLLENKSSRTGKALAVFLPWLRNEAKQKGFKQLVFESTAVPLIRFCRQFGFKPSLDEIVCEVEKP